MFHAKGFHGMMLFLTIVAAALAASVHSKRHRSLRTGGGCATAHCDVP